MNVSQENIQRNVKTLENSGNQPRNRYWRKRPDGLESQIRDPKLRDFFIAAQRYQPSNGESFTRGMERITEELGMGSRRTTQRRWVELKALGLAYSEERRVSRSTNHHNRFILLTIDELFSGVRLSSSGRKFVTVIQEQINKPTKAGTPRTRRAGSSTRRRVQSAPPPPSGRQLRQQQHAAKQERFGAWRAWRIKCEARRASEASLGVYTPSPIEDTQTDESKLFWERERAREKARLDAEAARKREAEEAAAERRRSESEPWSDEDRWRWNRLMQRIGGKGMDMTAGHPSKGEPYEGSGEPKISPYSIGQ